MVLMQDNTPIDVREPIMAIGTVADKVNASVSTIRKYEAAGFIIPFRTESGHRLFSLRDVDRIRMIQRLIQDRGLNIEGIRRLQALLPCWKILPCTLKKWNKCPAFNDITKPCWMIKGLDCVKQGNECRECKVYRFGSLHVEDIKQVVHSDVKDKGISKKVSELIDQYK
jgi:MerR family transcriptional regulator/heat shock protein HspR